MAKGLTRKFLTALGIDEDKADQIIEQHVAVTDELKQERDSYKTDADRYKATNAELAALKADYEALKKASDTNDNPFEKKYNDLKADYDKYKETVTAEKTHAAKEKAYRTVLKGLGIADKRIDSIVKVSEIDKVELDKDGSFKNKDDIEKVCKDEWSEFIPTLKQVGTQTATPPANKGGKMSKEDILKIKDTTERQAAIAANIELFDD